MKIIKISPIFLLVIFSCLFANCNKSSSEPSSNNPEDIVGTWDLIGITSEKGDDVYHVPQDEIEADPLRYIYYADRTALQVYQGKELQFRWSANETKLTHILDNGTGLVSGSSTYTVNANNLTQTFPISDRIITHTFKRN